MNRSRNKLIFTMKIFDLAIINFCLFFSSNYNLLIKDGHLSKLFLLRMPIPHLLFLIAASYIWHTTLSRAGFYRSRRLVSASRELLEISLAGTLAAAIISFIGHIVLTGFFSRNGLVLFWLSASSLLLCSRTVLRFLMHRLRGRGRNLRNLLIVGTNPRAINFAKKLSSRPELGYRIVGYADDVRQGFAPPLKGPAKGTLVCTLKDLPEFLRRNIVDEVLIALPMKTLYPQASEVVSTCEEQGIIVRVLYDLFCCRFAKSRMDNFENDCVQTLFTGASNPIWQFEMKRCLDFMLSLILIASLSPLFLLAAITIKLNSKGPIFYRQERLGLNKRRFQMIKFRTMVVDADKMQNEFEHLNESSGPTFKIKNDPRIFRGGHFLRKTSLDELPQLFNVFKGDMSLVGPRPLPVRDYEGFDKDLFRRRFSVRPGITCSWQVSGRNNISFDEWMNLDLRYIDGWSLWLDFKILAKTLPAVLKGTGAQ